MKSEQLSKVEEINEPSIAQSLHFYESLLNELSTICGQVSFITSNLSNQQQPDIDMSIRENDGTLTSMFRQKNDELNHKLSIIYANVRMIQEVLGIEPQPCKVDGAIGYNR